MVTHCPEFPKIQLKSRFHYRKRKVWGQMGSQMRLIC